jgi:hypothetical protein
VELRQETSFIECGNSLAHEYIPVGWASRIIRALCPSSITRAKFIAILSTKKANPDPRPTKEEEIGKTLE